MPSPKISIITPTHNRPELLGRAIESVLGQTFSDWEMIIIDDSTNNETKEFIKKYQHHPRITYLKNEKNEGAPFCRNVGLDKAQGMWITFLDDDDFLSHKEILGEVYKIIDNNNQPWFVFKKVDENNNSLTKEIVKKDKYNWTEDCLFGRKFRGDATHFIKRDFIDNVRNRGKHRSEWQFWFDLAKKGDFIYIDKIVHIGGYLEDGLMNNYVPKKTRFYLKQQLLETFKQPETLKFVPIALLRYLLSYTPVYKIKRFLFSDKPQTP